MTEVTKGPDTPHHREAPDPRVAADLVVAPAGDSIRGRAVESAAARLEPFGGPGEHTPCNVTAQCPDGQVCDVMNQTWV
jgi:hypothetical protein